MRSQNLLDRVGCHEMKIVVEERRGEMEGC